VIRRRLFEHFGFLLVLLLLSGTALGTLARPRDAHECILDAALVVIVSQQTADDYRIEEVFLGDHNPGDSLHLPGLKLFTRREEMPDIIDPILPNTRILLFLQHKKDDPNAWEPTSYGYCFFWVQESSRVFQLREIARQAVTLRQRWEQAASIPEPRKRVEALWPYLHLREYGARIFERTKLELQKTGPVAGDYIAEQLDALPRLDWPLLCHEAGVYGSEKLHQTVIRNVRDQQQLYERLVVGRGLDRKAAVEDWNALPDEAIDASGGVYYG
jgi:hypothetical protein